MQAWERVLERWQGAGLVDASTAERIRTFEAADTQPSGQRWQVVLALLLGGILLGAGVLLFVAAHWDDVGPGARLATVLLLLSALHAGGALAAERFPMMSTALHGVGTVACGAAIAMVGQIFNMQEHWPAAVLLWAVCAAVGWWLLHDQFQQVCTLLLLPAWLICEWSYHARTYSAGDVYLSRMVAVIAAVYLSAFVHSRRQVVAGVLFGFAAVLLLVSTVILNEGWNRYTERVGLPAGYWVSALLIIAAAVAAGFIWNRRSVLVAVAVLFMSFALPWLQETRHADGRMAGIYQGTMPSLFAYLLVAAVTAFLAWWGVQERSRAVVNYAVAMFAVVVLWFYFSDLMDKLGRSLGLIGLGLLFLLGGWQLEHFRRKLMSGLRTESGSGVTA